MANTFDFTPYRRSTVGFDPCSTCWKQACARTVRRQIVCLIGAGGEQSLSRLSILVFLHRDWCEALNYVRFVDC